MRKKIELYLKLFLVMMVPFSIIMGIFYSFQTDFSTGMISGVVSGIIYGALVAYVFYSLQVWSVKKLPYEKSEDMIDVNQSRIIELQLSYDKVFALCLKSLDLNEKVEIQEEKRFEGKIEAKDKKWKNIISFNILKLDDNSTQVEISSRPISPLVFVDYGKNFENVERISSFLKEENELV